MKEYGIFRYRNFPKRHNKDIRVKVCRSEKDAVRAAIKMNEDAGLYGARYYWRPLEETES